MTDVTVAPVTTKRERDEFIDLAYRLNKDDPNWVPPLRSDVAELLDRDEEPVLRPCRDAAVPRRAGADGSSGAFPRISTSWRSTLPPEQGMGPGTGNWGMLEAEDEEIAARADRRGRGLAARQGHDARAGADQPVDLGRAGPAGQRLRSPADGDDGPRQSPHYQGWIEARGLRAGEDAADLRSRHHQGFPAAGQAHRRRRASSNPRISIREVGYKPSSRAKRRSSSTSSTMPGRTTGASCRSPSSEIAYVGKKLKPMVQRGPDAHRRTRRRAGRLHDDPARRQRADQAVQRQAAARSAGSSCCCGCSKPQVAHDARAADGRGQGAAGIRAWPASSLS